MDEKINILLVDDNPEDLYSMSAILERPDYHIDSASTGKLALNKIIRNEYAVVVINVSLPDLGGFELAATMKQSEKSRYIPIVFVATVATSLKEIYEGYAIGAVDYLQKPIEPVILRAKVSAFVELYRKNKQIEKQALIIVHNERSEYIEKFKRLEERYGSLVNSLDHAIIWEASADFSKFNFVSRRAQVILGYSQEQWFDEPNFFLNHIPQEDHPLILSILDKVSKPLSSNTNELGERCEHRLKSLNGSVYWFHTGIQPIRDQNGIVVILRGLSVDITPLKSVESALRESEERLEMALRSARMGIWDWNILTGSLVVSDTLQTLWGYKPGEFSGNIEAFWRHIHSEDRPRVQEAVSLAIEKADEYVAEFRVLPPGQEEIWVYVRGRGFPNLAMRTARMFGIAIEITERKKVEEDLKNSEEWYRTLVEGIQDYGIIKLNPGGYVEGWNRGAQILLGYTSEEVIGKQIAFIFTEEDVQNKVHEKEMQEAYHQNVAQDERWHKRKDGTRIFVRGSLDAIKKGRQVLGYIKVMRDETERKTAEVERERIVHDLHEALRMRDEVVSVVAHDLKNPLTAIQLSASILLKSLDQKDHEKIKQHAERIKRATDRAINFAQSILDLSKIEAGRFKIEPMSEDPVQILQEMEDLFHPIAMEKGINLVLNIQEGIPEIFCDYERLMQVLSNLIANAIKFAHRGGKIEISAKKLKNTVLFTVADNGPGIPSEQLPCIFGKFWQGGKSAKKGIGLGLHIAKGIVEAHHGKIGVKSKQGEGASFFFEIPIYQAVSKSHSVPGAA